ncbi:DUF883 family protein [Stutzerimonas tarimensis]|uniref:YqjD family protein n=1 Tax=Stutzerimonas tarimensis TaxID=1507735 RepID=A0ABV7T3Z2_9GAMM
MTLEPTNNDVTGNDVTGVSPEATSQSDKAEKAPLVNKEAHRKNLQAAQNALVDEFHTLIADAERLLKFTQGSTDSQASELREKVNENISRAKSMLHEREEDVRGQCQVYMQSTEEYVHSRPWQALGIAAGVGFLLGLVTRR